MSSGFVFSKRSKENLEGVHPRLVAVIEKALDLSEVDFVVTEGLRSEARQQQMVAEGKSQTKNSRHLKQKDGYSHAVDVAALYNNKITWEWKYYEMINAAVQSAASILGEKVTWGGTWKTLRDGPHFQIEGL